MEPEPRKIETSISDSHGILVGDGGIQFNYAGRATAGDNVIDQFAPRYAAGQLRAMPFRAAFQVLAEAPVDKAAAVLRLLLASSDALVVALIAEMHPERVRALVDAGGAELEVLRDIREADDQISDCLDTLHPALGAEQGGLRRVAPSPRGNTGFYRRFEHGAIFWSSVGGAVPLSSPFFDFHGDAGGTGGRLGFPIDVSRPVTGRGVVTEAHRQDFEFDEHSRRTSAYCTTEYGVFATWGGIGEHYDRRGGPDRFGFPTGPEVVIGPTRRRGTGDSGWIQAFEKGSIAYTDSTSAIEIMSPVRDYYDANGGAAGRLGFPRGSSHVAGRSPQGTDGRFQRFEGAWDYPDDLLAACIGFGHPGGASVYTSVHGTHKVDGGIGILYERMGGTAGWLGFPTEGSQKADDQRRTQGFEGGAIYWCPEHNAVPVRMDVLALLHPDIGFPTHAEQPIGAGPDTIQFFEAGIVTRRSTGLTVWHP
uniref:LGFP repeat-containing protein n=1 Tax=Paractinoplanes polyasparticus TaxID=2856853 RepID=UPI001C859045|nr:hypothetical protein [Actinoplanes polyasparticus]